MIEFTANQVTALRALATQDYPTISEIAEIGRMTPSAARGAVKALVRQSLAEQAGSAASGGATFTLTNVGRLTLDDI